jgi:hypothetical protein
MTETKDTGSLKTIENYLGVGNGPFFQLWCSVVIAAKFSSICAVPYAAEAFILITHICQHILVTGYVFTTISGHRQLLHGGFRGDGA